MCCCNNTSGISTDTFTDSFYKPWSGPPSIFKSGELKGGRSDGLDRAYVIPLDNVVYATWAEGDLRVYVKSGYEIWLYGNVADSFLTALQDYYDYNARS